MRPRHCSLVLALCLLLANCGGVRVYRPSTAAGFQIEPEYEIDDDHIRRAFEAKPQISLPAKVAYFSFDPERGDEIGRALAKSPAVSKTHAIPTVLVTGQRRFDDVPRWAPTPKAPSIKKLRLLAARANCDLLVVFDYGNRVARRANWLLVFNVALVPLLFVPYLDEEVESYLDAYIVDVRNGYLYGRATAQERAKKDFNTILSKWSEERVDAQWGQLLTKTHGALARLVKRH